MSTPIELPADVHPGLAPPWWPPAPGWWLVFAAVLLLALALAGWWRRRRRRRARVSRLFDDALRDAATPSEQVAAMSELLRRAARRVRADADRLEGDEWLRFLDEGLPQPVFAAGAGTLLRDGGFRRDVSDAEVGALRALAHERYLRWMRA